MSAAAALPRRMMLLQAAAEEWAQLEAFPGETTGLGIELRNGSNSEVPIQFEDEKATSSRWNGLAVGSLAQSETPRPREALERRA
jgi:hypothetical protein